VTDASGDAAVAAARFRDGLAAAMRLRRLSGPTRLSKTLAARSTWAVLLVHLVRQAIDEAVDPDAASRRDSCFDHLGLGQVFALALPSLGAEEDSWHLVSLIRLMHRLPALASVSKKPAADRAAALVRALTEDEAVGSFIGVNVWEDVAWFNREAYATLLTWLDILDALAAASGKRLTEARLAERLGETDRLITALLEAGEKSGYQLDKLEAATRA
jgi:hypothetical protein